MRSSGYKTGKEPRRQLRPLCAGKLDGRTLGNADSPDKKMSIIVSSPKRGLTSLFSGTGRMGARNLSDDKVDKNSSTEFQMEGKSTSGKPNVYRLSLPEPEYASRRLPTKTATRLMRRTQRNSKAAK